MTAFVLAENRARQFLALASALVLDGVFIGYAIALKRRYNDERARATFKYSILCLTALFSALLVDHYWA